MSPNKKLLIDFLQLHRQLFVWIIFLMGFLFVGSMKALLAWLVVAVYVFFLLGWDLLSSLFLSFWMTLLFRQLLVGTWLEVVAADPITYLRGFSYSFGLHAAYIWAVMILLIGLVNRKKIFKLKNKLSTPLILLLSLGLWAVISSVLASRIDLALTGLVSLLIGVFIFTMSSLMFQQSKLRRELRIFILASLMLLGLIGTAQYFWHHSLGIFIETRSSYSSAEFLTTDGIPLYRVTGISPHPTFFASLLALMLLPVFGLAVEAWQQKNNLLFKASVVAIGLGLVALLATFSRSSYLAVFMTGLFFVQQLFLGKILSLKKMEIYLKKWWWGWLLFGVALSLFVYQVLARIGSLATVWTVGNWDGRAQLIRHSLEMIKSSPFVGVGLNHFPAVMVNQGVPIEYRGFIFPVHNTFLLFLSELGVIGGGLFLAFVAIVMVRSWKLASTNWFGLGVWLGLLTFVVNAQFHTLFNQDPSFNIFMLLSGYLVALYKNENQTSRSDSSYHH